jgi:multiple sugar transport system ATP-binding protein
MRAELIRLQKRLKITTVYVTHDQVEAMTMADRIGVLHKGRLMQCGIPIEIYKNPSNLFVAGFIGSPPMNFFDCYMADGNNGCLEASGFTLKLPIGVFKAIKNKTDVTEFILGIRPQDIVVSAKPKSPESIEAEIYAIEPLGSETLVDLKLGDNIVKVVTSEEYSGMIGEKAWITIDINKIYLFDKKTEKNIL